MDRASREARGCPIFLSAFRRSTRGGAWVQDTWQTRIPWVGAGGSPVGPRGHHTRDAAVAKGLGIGGPRGVDSSQGRGGSLHPEPRVREARPERLCAGLDRATPSGTLRSERSLLASGGVSSSDLGGGAVLRVEGYRKRFTDLLIGRLEPEAERLSRVGRYDFPAALTSSVPVDPIITTMPRQRRPGPRLRIRPVRVAHERARQRSL